MTLPHGTPSDGPPSDGSPSVGPTSDGPTSDGTAKLNPSLCGQMMERPLLITLIMQFAEQCHARREIVSVTFDNPLHRYDYATAFARTRRLAGALIRLGMKPGDRIGTLAWNDHRHFEIYYATGCAGAVCHTINPRLFDDQLVYIINHAEDRWIFVDPSLAPLLERIVDRLTHVEGVVFMTDQAHMPSTATSNPLLANALCYEELLSTGREEFVWPELDERTAAALCYTSGTTGNPKGVLYSHRSTVLHAYSICLPDVLGLSSYDAVLPIVPMFHVCAWGIPYAAPMVGAKLILPGPKMGDGFHLQSLIENEKATCALAVPTVWLSLLAHLRQQRQKLTSLRRIVVGGAACPSTVIDEFRDVHGVHVHHAWGMTETSPLGTFNRSKPGMEALTEQERREFEGKQGRTVFGIELKVVDDANRELPRDGVSVGALKVRGPFVASDYFRSEQPSEVHDHEGWFDTGDVATIDAEGYMQIVDRTKDLIKSGGEWISSIELENAAVGHPQVAMAAAIAIPHPTWGERPLLVVVRRQPSASPSAAPASDRASADAVQRDLTREDLLAWLADKVAKWWLPDDVLFVDALPMTATGKINKRALRRSIADQKADVAPEAVSNPGALP